MTRTHYLIYKEQLYDKFGIDYASMVAYLEAEISAMLRERLGLK